MSIDCDAARVFPFELMIGSARLRWSCPLACGWFYDEDPYSYPCRVALPRVPEDCTQEEIAAAVSESAAKQNAARFAALETLFGEHLKLEHPGVTVQDLLDRRPAPPSGVVDGIRPHRPMSERDVALTKAAELPPEAEIRRLWFGEWKGSGDVES